MIPYDERVKTYTNAIITNGPRHQLLKAVEELSELGQVLCKVINGEQDLNHLAEEMADVYITMEQVRLIFDIDDRIRDQMDFKVRRLDDNLKK